MISGKGILYTVLGAASAAIVVGSVLTGGARGEKIRSFRSGIQNFFGSLNRRRSIGNAPDAVQRREYDQASTMGRS